MPIDKVTSKIPISQAEAAEFLDSDAAKKLAKTVHRADLLPLLFKLNGKPYTLNDYPQFREMYAPIYTPDSIWVCGRQIGKCCSLSTLYVSKDNGQRTHINDLKITDKILSIDNNLKCVINKVTDKFYSGNKDLYQVKTRMGSVLEISMKHRLKTNNEFTALNNMMVGTKVARLYKGGVFNNVGVPYDKIIVIANMFAADRFIGLYDNSFPDWVFNLSKINTALFIASLCKATGIKQNKNATVVYQTSNRHIIAQLRDLLHKFGIPSTIANTQIGYELIIAGQFKPTSLITSPNMHSNKSVDVIWDEIISIEYIGVKPAWDITVENTECFILDGIVSHNSLNLSRSEVLDCVQIPYFQLLYIAPLKPQALRYSSTYLIEAINTCNAATKLRDMELTAEAIESGASSRPITSNLMHQTFGNGSGIQLTYAKTSSDRARGIYADRIDFDEIQDQLIDNIPIVTQSLSQSEWGVRRFTGTAKTVDNTIEFLWQESSQNEWAMRCGCGYWNIPNMEGKVMDMIQVDGPHCVKCGKLLNVRNGAFVPKYKNKVRSFQGYHVPQIVVPAITENPKKWSRLLHKVLKSPLPVIMQEILGISCNIGSRLITQEDIDRNCILPPVDNLKDRLNDYAFTVGGVDWGVAESTSFTVHTIVGIRHDGKVHVLWANRFAGFDPDTVLQEIAKAHTYYRCSLICCDYGMGFDKNVMLTKRFDLPVIQIAYTSQNQLLTFNPTLGYARWVIDKVSALELLFWTIKYNGIQFPPKADFDKYTKDLLSPYEDITEISGISHRKFLRNPTQPDDFCNALCYAVLGAFKLTGNSSLDMVPETAMNKHGVKHGIPQQTTVDPNELLSL